MPLFSLKAGSSTQRANICSLSLSRYSRGLQTYNPHRYSPGIRQIISTRPKKTADLASFAKKNRPAKHGMLFRLFLLYFHEDAFFFLPIPHSPRKCCYVQRRRRRRKPVVGPLGTLLEFSNIFAAFWSRRLLLPFEEKRLEIP